MNPDGALDDRERVERFQREHRLGLVTMVFTDIVGSTQLKQDLGEREAVALIYRHHHTVRELLGRFPEAQEINTAGDSFFLVFAKPSEAARFSLLLVSRLRTLCEGGGYAFQDRIGIHVGEVFVEQEGGSQTATDFYGSQVDTCARVMSLAQGSQILMSRFVFDNARRVLKGTDVEASKPLTWLNHGPYVLKGVEDPLEICEVGIGGVAPLSAPPNSEKARRHHSDESEPVLGWRPAVELRVPGTEWVLEKKLGEGGFGEVWLGRHEKLKDRRVFKFCFRADRVRSLKREVTLFRVLKERVGHHPNIVGVQEVYFNEPPYYIVMDYAEAKDLRAWSEERGGLESISLEEKLEIVAQVADGLQAAHEAGVIHRDVKPSNILVSNPKSESQSSKLEAKLTDFGIGQVVSQEALAGLTRMGFTQTMLSPGSSSHTGTQLYMAPELLAGKAATSRSDIFSLGVVLYQLLIGDFSQPLTTDWTKRISDPLLREDLEMCFAGKPEERFSNPVELSRKLHSLTERRRALARGLALAARRRMAARAAIAAFLIVGVVILWVASRQHSPTAKNKVRDRDSGTRNPQAAAFYVRGKGFIKTTTTKTNLLQAISCFQQATNSDPNYALAYVGLGEACERIYETYEPAEGWDRQSLEAVNKALKINPNLADAYVLRGRQFFSRAGKWDAKSAVESQFRAIQLDPEVEGAHYNLGFVYHHVGLLDEAIAEFDREIERMDKVNYDAFWLKHITLIYRGRTNEAATLLNEFGDSLFPSKSLMLWHRGVSRFSRGLIDEGLNFLESHLTDPTVRNDPLVTSLLAVLYASRGDGSKAEEFIAVAKQGEKRFIHFHHAAYQMAEAYSLLNRTGDALFWLKRAVDEGFPCYLWFKADPNLDKLRSDRDFQVFLEEQRRIWEHNKSTLLK